MTKQQREPDEGGQPTIRDRRRIDPTTGERRASEDTPAPAAGAGGAGAAGAGGAAPSEALVVALDEARAESAERLDDLRRLQAEYLNYRKRVERDRELVRENVKIEVLGGLLGVLDDIGRARDHGDLNGGFRAVAEALEATTTKAGLVRFGEPGDAFDPTIHEALMHGYSDEVDVPTCTQILQPGYRVGERVVRPARVAVAEPTEVLPAHERRTDSAEAAGDDTDGAEDPNK